MKPDVKSSIIPKMFRNQIGNFGIPALKSYNKDLASDYYIYQNVEKSWGYGLLINNEPMAGKRAAGSVSWTGVLNTYFWVDSKSDMAGVFLTQILPCYTPTILKAFRSFEELSYKYLVKS